MKQKAYFNWSGGKDSSLALYKVLKDGLFEVELLFTSINKKNQRVSMHGVRLELLKKQAESIGIPLKILSLQPDINLAEYEKQLLESTRNIKSQGITTAIFGDIFLEDLKEYREKQLSKMDLKCTFPIWKIPTEVLIREFLTAGFKAIITCVDASVLDKSFVGRIIDDDFIKDLPANVDVCGENGEFHSFVFDGPIFKSLVKFDVGNKTCIEYSTDNDSGVCEPKKINRFWYCDLTT